MTNEWTVKNILSELHKSAQPANLDGMARYGMTTTNRLGINIPILRTLAKKVGTNHHLAIDLWRTGIAEARILAALIDDPQAVTSQQMEEWVADFDSWDICDQVCLNLFDKTPLVWVKIRAWAQREEEFVRRAAFALIAATAWHDKQAGDRVFIDLIPVIFAAAEDERNYVRKGVSWALRHIGKRNLTLNKHAIQAAEELVKQESRTAQWIGRDALKDISRESVLSRLRKRSDRGH